MTVAELIEKLQATEPFRIVVLSRDEEGNGYAELRGVQSQAYKDGQVGYESLTDDDRKLGYSEADMLTGGTPCVVLWP